MGAEGPPSERVPELLAHKGAEELFAAPCEVSAHRATSGVGCPVGIPAALEVEEFEKMPSEEQVFGIDLAVSIMDGPDLSEKRRKELALARLMAETIGVILYTGEPDSDIRIEAAKDIVREFRHVYPEIAEI